MAWYWPELKTPQSAKTAVVNAVGVSVLLALLPFGWLPQTFESSSRGQHGRLWVALAISVLFAVIAWGIHRMSRMAAVAGALLCFVWVAVQLPSPFFLLATDAYPLTAIGIGLRLLLSNPFMAVSFALRLLFLLFYIIAIRATRAYARFKVTTPNAIRI